MKKLFIYLILIATTNTNYVNATEAIGFYSNGSLKNAESVIDRKLNIHKLFIARQKFFTTNEMLDTISNSIDFLKNEYPNSEPLQIGDLSPKMGGNAPGHASHQNGLDIDVVYLTKNQKLQSPNATYWEEEFVIKNQVSSNFHTERNLQLFKHLVNQSFVERIFVDRAIKKHLCEFAKNNGLYNDPQIQETLRRLRPQDLHSTHFHLRLFCPKSDLQCTPQSLVPSGTGCDDLDILLNDQLKEFSC